MISNASRTRPHRCAPWMAYLGHVTAAVIAAAFCVFVSPNYVSAAPVKAEASATISNGFVRLVLTFNEAVETEVRQTNGIVVIGFKRPVDIDVEQLPLAVPDYVGIARRDPDGAAVRLALKRKMIVHSIAAGERFYVDLLPEGWTGPPPALPKEVVEDLARRARLAERKLREQQQQARKREPILVRMRVAAQPTFTRYSFDLPASVGVVTEREKNALKLLFDARLTFEMGDASASLPPTVSSIEAEPGDTTSSVTFALLGKTDARTFREDNAFVLDISIPEDRERQSNAEHVLAAASEAMREPSSAANASSEKPITEAPPIPAAQVSAPPPAVVEAAKTTAKPASTPVVAALKQQGETIRLFFPFAKPTPAAVFRRGDMLWLVFDTAEPLDLARLREAAGAGIRGAETMRSGDSQVVRLKLVRPRLSSMSPDGDAWVVTIGDIVLEPTAPIFLERNSVNPANVSARIAFDAPHKMHRLNDPDIGDELIAVTALGPARGFLKLQELVEFRALASTHGVVIQPLAQDISLWLAPDAILLSRPGGLSLSATLAANGVNGEGYSHSTPLDPQAWGFDQQADFAKRQTALMEATADAPEDKRTEPRLELARFYLARGLYSEAKSVLDLALRLEREDRERSPLVMLRAIASTMMGHHQGALKDLADPALGAHDPRLWRALAQAGQGAWADARAGLGNAEIANAQLPLELQRHALVAGVRLAVETGDFAEASRWLNDLDSIGAPAEFGPRLSVLKGQVAEGLGRVGDALAAYASAAQSLDREAVAQAALRRIALRLRIKEGSREDAITQLEILAATWRGDQTEIETLSLLSGLYSEEARYRDSFHLMRIALTAHPASPLTRRMQTDAAAVFDTVFLSDQGTALPPVEALGLFYDFSELTPIGRRGDEMIRRLSERLIDVDLLNQATELLQHQIDNRLQGAARSQVAARLATVHLMNRKPERALGVLRSTRVADMPRDLRQQRMLLESRALSDTGRHDVALELIANLDGREVDRLRADIHWQARRWRATAEHIEQMYGERWRDFAPLDDAERNDILRAAISYALAADVLGLDRFRQKYIAKMIDGPERRIFEIITAPQSVAREEFREAAKVMSSVDTLRAFLKDMKQRFPEPRASIAQAR